VPGVPGVPCLWCRPARLPARPSVAAAGPLKVSQGKAVLGGEGGEGLWGLHDLCLVWGRSGGSMPML
jgi:hypothetical protein